jgi:hypothetical protein
MSQAKRRAEEQVTRENVGREEDNLEEDEEEVQEMPRASADEIAGRKYVGKVEEQSLRRFAFELIPVILLQQLLLFDFMFMFVTRLATNN